MATTKKVISKSATVSGKVKGYGNDPFVLKKNREAKAFLEKHGFPKEFISSRSHKGRIKI